MVENGTLRELKEVLLLVLYVLKSAKKPLTKEEVTEIIMNNSLVDYFMLPQAITELTKTDHIVEFANKNEISKLHITALGNETIDELYKFIPLYIREKAEISTFSMLSTISRSSQIKTDLIEENGGFSLNLSIYEDTLCLFNTSIFVANRLQGETIIKSFKKNPEYYYKRVITCLTTDAIDE